MFFACSLLVDLLVTNIQATANETALLVQWDSDSSPCKQSDIDYVVEYQLINLDQCSQVMDNDMYFNTLTQSTILSNLEYHSNYTIQVTARRNGVEIQSTVATTNATTQQGGKSLTIGLFLNIPYERQTHFYSECANSRD